MSRSARTAWHRESPPMSPRVLLVSQRAASCSPSRTLFYEYEDLIRALDSADLIAPEVRGLSAPIVRRARSAVTRFAPGASLLLDGVRPIVEGSYELVFVAVESLADLERIPQLRWILRRARTSVCLLDEVWRKGLERRTGELRILKQFDRVLMGTSGAVDVVSELIGRPAVYLPPSIDALALCPHPEWPARVIDVYSMGRRSQQTHAALLQVAERHRWFYVYDTLSRARAVDHRMHRRYLADVLKRARRFLAYPGKMDVPEETAGQQEIGYRYFEGAAAGTILFGMPPDNPWFERLLGWTDSVLPLRYGCDDVELLTAALELDQEREQRIRRRNVTQSLLRHDHVYRWAAVLQAVGLPETPGMELRRQQLRSLASAISQTPAPEALQGGATL